MRLLRRMPATIATWSREGGDVERVQHLERVGNALRGAAWRQVAADACHDDRDVVLAAPIVRDLNQTLARRVQPRRAQDDLTNLVVADRAREAIRAEDEAVATAQLELCKGDLDLGLVAHRLQNHVAER